MKAITPVRRSRSGRPNTGDGVPVTASMELLPPEAASSPSMSGAFNSHELHGSQSKDFMAMGAPATLQQGSRPGTMRRTSSAHNPREQQPVVLLSSTRPVAESPSVQGQPIGMLLQQLPSQSHSLASQSLVSRSSMNRYGAGGSSSIPAVGRPTSAASSTASSMLVGGVPGPLPATTPGTLSRLWTPESCDGGFELDDSANTRACTASSLHGRGMSGMAHGAVHGGRPVSVHEGRGGQHGDTDMLTEQQSFPQEHAEFYSYLESRRPTEEGGVEGEHAFTVPAYHAMEHMSASRQSMRPSHTAEQSYLHMDPGAHNEDDDGDCQSVASGVMRDSGVFFTALRRSLGGKEAELDDEASILSARSGAPTEVLSVLSRANPMQEPSAAPSQRPAPSQGGPGSEAGYGAEAEDTELTDYLTAYDADEDGCKSVWDNPVQTPRETSAAPTAEPSRASFVSLLRDLYSDNGIAPQGEQQEGQEGYAEQAEHDSPGDGDVEPEGAELRVSVAAMAEAQAVQDARREELNEYMEGLQSKLDEEGHALVELPGNYQVLIEQLLMARRAEYASLAGWLGPRKFSDLPIHQLPDTHEDPKVAEGLVRIRALDARLAEKEAEAIIVARERDPERWAELERARRTRQALAVEEALKRERMRRMRSAKLARALTPSSSVHGDELRASTAMSTTSSRLGPAQRLLALRPDEELLVEQVLRRDDGQGEANPFELSGTASMPPEATPTDPAAPSGRPGSALSPAGIGAAPGLAGQQGLVLAPLALSSPLTGLQGEASAAQLLRMAHQVATGLAAQSSGLLGDLPQPDTGHQRPCGPSADGGSSSGRRDSSADGSERVDLAAGLAVHTRALLRAQQAAVAGMQLGAINAHLEHFAQEHLWTADGSLADFTSLSSGPAAGTSAAVAGEPHRERGPGRSSVPGHAGNARGGVGAGNGEPPPMVSPAPRPAPPASTSGTGAGGPQKRDYLREEREAKELIIKEADLDTRIRAFKTSDPAGTRLSSDQLAALVQECRAQAERAADRQQLQRQQQLQQLPDNPTIGITPATHSTHTPQPRTSQPASTPEVRPNQSTATGKQASGPVTKGKPKAGSGLNKAGSLQSSQPTNGTTPTISACSGTTTAQPRLSGSGPQGVAKQRPSSATPPAPRGHVDNPSHSTSASNMPEDDQQVIQTALPKTPSAGRRAGSDRTCTVVGTAPVPVTQTVRPASGGQVKAGRRSGSDLA